MSAHGGKRENAGRPIGQGKFGEPTKIMRIPESQTATVRSCLEALQRKRSQVENDSAVTERLEYVNACQDDKILATCHRTNDAL